jgi:hypothetical protein
VQQKTAILTIAIFIGCCSNISAGFYEDAIVRTEKIRNDYNILIDTVAVENIPALLSRYLQIAYINYNSNLRDLKTDWEIAIKHQDWIKAEDAISSTMSNDFFRSSKLSGETFYNISTDCVKRIRNIKDQRLFELLLEFYSMISEMRELANNPKGSYNSFINKIDDFEINQTRLRSKLDIFLDSKIDEKK